MYYNTVADYYAIATYYINVGTATIQCRVPHKNASWNLKITILYVKIRLMWVDGITRFTVLRSPV